MNQERNQGDCWFAVSLAKDSGLILSGRIGRHTDELLGSLLVSTEGKTDCRKWQSDDWGGYERVLPPEVAHEIGKTNTQRLERTNGIVRQQTGRWHRRQNKFGKVWEQTETVSRLVITYFNWIWKHSRLKSTAAQRSGLTSHEWTWKDIGLYPKII